MYELLLILQLGVLTLVLAVSPSNNYAPAVVQCPAINNGSFLREASSISDQEKAWVESRQQYTSSALVDYLDRVELTDFDAAEFMQNASSPPNIGLAFSGGGFRAMLNGAGHLAALDNRTENADENALGGILQASNYVSSLSGGAWLMGSLIMQNFTSVQQIVYDDNQIKTWDLSWGHQLFADVQAVALSAALALGQLDKVINYLNSWSFTKGGIAEDLAAKQKAGFNTTITDAWGRLLSRQLFPSKNNYLDSSLWSDIRNYDVFKNHQMPFPLVAALGRKPGTYVYNMNSTIVEFNPFEMGSFDPSVNSFADLKYIGTKVNNGKPVDSCINGYDNSAFIIGTSSSLFNEFLETLVCDSCTGVPSLLKPILKFFLNLLRVKYEDVAEYNPNPFYNSEFSGSTNLSSNDTLYLFDGGLGGEIIPLSPLIVKARKLDAVFAFDSSSGWPDGSALVNAYERQFSDQGKENIFPYVPDQENFLRQNLTARPTFFGCDAKNLTALEKDGVIPPVVLYFANRPFDFLTNTSTFKLEYSDSEKKSMIKNGFDVVSRLNMTLDSEWNACVGCAVIRRLQERDGIEQSDQCKKCFERYCWDGTLLPAEPGYVQPMNFDATGLINSTMTLPIVA